MNHACRSDSGVLRRIGQALGLIFVLCCSSCTPLRLPSEPPKQYHPARISSQVLELPGSISWAPDGKRIAFITTAVNIYDRALNTTKTIPIAHPIDLLWTAEHELLVLSRATGTAVLSVIDPDTLHVAAYSLDGNADTLARLDANTLLVSSLRTANRSIGTELDYTLFRYDRRSRTRRTLFSFNRIYPLKNAHSALLKAWLWNDLNPLDRSFLALELIKPPVVGPYSRIHRIDAMTGEDSEIAVAEKKIYVSAAWSPDGNRLGLVDTYGRLGIMDLRASADVAEASVVGYYPSWNPRGSLLYFGGYLVQSNGTTEAMLLPDRPMSFAHWSPDGTRLAIVAGQDLWLLDNFEPFFFPPDKPLNETLRNKLSLLKNLLNEGLITPQEYRNRRTKLLER